MSGYFGHPNKQQKNEYKKRYFVANHVKNGLNRIVQVKGPVPKQPIKPHPPSSLALAPADHSPNTPPPQDDRLSVPSCVLTDVAPSNTLKPLKSQSTVKEQLKPFTS